MNTIEQIVQAFLELYKQTLTSKGKSASGTLINTASYKIEWNGDIFTVTLNLTDYWSYVEYGRKPGKFPPVSKIKEWITPAGEIKIMDLANKIKYHPDWLLKESKCNENQSDKVD